MYVYMCTCVYIYIYIYIYTYVYDCNDDATTLCMYTCVRVCAYCTHTNGIHTYTHKHMHTHTYSHKHMHRYRRNSEEEVLTMLLHTYTGYDIHTHQITVYLYRILEYHPEQSSRTVLAYAK
jgi:hypothetical protein